LLNPDHVRVRARPSVPLAAAVVLAVLAAPATASAHLRSGTVAVDYKPKVLTPETRAYKARIFQSDNALSLTLRPGHVVLALGYLGEPMFRLDGAGLWVNASSPTAATARLVSKAKRVAAATPHWRLQRNRRSVIWQDARSRSLPPGVTRGSWSLPLIVDGSRTHLVGELRRFPAPALWPWLVVLAAFFAGGAIVPARRRDLLRPAAICFAVVAAVASIVVALAFALDAYASPGTWIAGFDELIFMVVGLAVLERGPRHLHVGAAIGLGLLGLAVGLSKGAVFFHPIVLAVLPAIAIRLIVVTAVGAGLTGGALGCAFYASRPTRIPG
jgi:hypothetical protein